MVGISNKYKQLQNVWLGVKKTQGTSEASVFIEATAVSITTAL